MDDLTHWSDEALWREVDDIEYQLSDLSDRIVSTFPPFEGATFRFPVYEFDLSDEIWASRIDKMTQSNVDNGVETSDLYDKLDAARALQDQAKKILLSKTEVLHELADREYSRNAEQYQRDIDFSSRVSGPIR